MTPAAKPAVKMAKRVGAIVGIVILAAIVLGAAGWTISRFFPRHDPTPIVTARKDEKAAAVASDQVGKQTAAANHDTTTNLDITVKGIRDAFDAPQPVQPSSSAAPAGGAALPPAPVDRLRDRLNESIARANRAADTAGPAD